MAENLKNIVLGHLFENLTNMKIPAQILPPLLQLLCFAFDENESDSPFSNELSIYSKNQNKLSKMNFR